jgi:DNA-binding Lrp family transcriptional regulator
MDAYVGLEAEPESQSAIYRILRERGVETYQTLGAHQLICRLQSFATIDEFRKLIDSMLFTTENNRPLVENMTSYIIVNHHRKKTEKPTAFAFIRSSKLPSREKFDKMVTNVLAVPCVVAVSVVIGLFDLVCEVVTRNVAELGGVVDEIVSVPGVSSRSRMVCIVLET